MNRVLPFLVGPELFWALTCMLATIATRRGSPPNPAVTDWLDRYWPVMPLVFVPLTFMAFLLPGSGRWWLLLRIDLAVLIGLGIATQLYCKGMMYHQPSSGPGAGTAFMAIIGLGYMVLAVGTLIAVPLIWWRGRGAG